MNFASTNGLEQKNAQMKPAGAAGPGVVTGAEGRRWTVTGWLHRPGRAWYSGAEALTFVT